MPTNFSTSIFGTTASVDDLFVPADSFRQGNLFTWGQNTNGQLGVNDIVNRSTPVQIFTQSTNWKQVDSGNGFTATIKSDGTLWTWGYGQNGQLGNNIASKGLSIFTPVTTFVGGTNWKQVSTSAIAAAIKTDGTLWTWGNGVSGGLGDNTATIKCTPVTTFAGGTNWKQVSGGGYHTVTIKTDGTLWTWGYNNNGQLGVNDTNTRCTPVTTFAGGTDWKQVSCAESITGGIVTAIKTDGTLWTWGPNNNGQLGVNDTNTRCTPVTTFAGGTNWKQVSCGYNHTTAIKTDGTLWTWGSNDSGQLGDNTVDNRSTPVTTFSGGTNWKQVAGGSSHTAAIKTDGTLWTWGSNTVGQLGDNTATIKCTPVTTFAGGSNWKQVAGGFNHTAATTYIDSYQ